MASALAQSFDKLNEIPTSSGNNVESKRKIQREIMDDCELTWERIQETHHRLKGHKKEKPPTGTNKSNATLSILKHKEKRLQAQIDVIKNQDNEVVSKDLQFAEILLQDNIKNNISQLEQALGIVKEQRLEVAGDIAMQRKLLDEQETIQRSLQQKIQTLKQFNDEDHQENSVLAELQAKKKEVSKYHLTVMNQLGKFLSNHFPVPRSDSSDSEEETSRPYCSLQHIVETLMNRLFESPHDCYVKIQPTYWPPYIKLLLQSNIIQRHPDNCDLIRLVAFHK